MCIFCMAPTYTPQQIWEGLNGVLAYMLDTDIEVGEFKFELCYYVPIRTNAHEKTMNPFIFSVVS